MMNNDYNFDLISNNIFDNIIINDDMNLNEIFSINFLEDLDFLNVNQPNISSDSTQLDAMNTFSIPTPTSSESVILKHDCMWSGICNKTHNVNKKKKAFNVSAIIKEFEGSSSESEEDEYEELEQPETKIFPKTSQLYQNLTQQPKPSKSTFKVPEPYKLPTTLPSSLIIQEVFPKPTVVVEQLPQPIPTIQQASRHQFQPPVTLMQPLLNVPTLSMAPVFAKIEKNVSDQSCVNIINLLQPQTYFMPSNAPIPTIQKLKCNVTPINKAPMLQPQLKFQAAVLKPIAPAKNDPLAIPDLNSIQIPSVSQLMSDNLPTPLKRGTTKIKKRKYSSNLKTTKSSKIPRTNRNDVNESKTYSYEISYEKRTIHNDMERKRRISMKMLFEELKKAIPSIVDQERVPKVNILRAASIYCREIQTAERKLIELRHQNCKLTNHLQKLMKSFSCAPKNKKLSIGSLDSSSFSTDLGSE